MPPGDCTPQQAAWEMARRVLHLLQVNPSGLGGVWLRAAHGPVRTAWLEVLGQSHLPVVKLPLNIDGPGLHGGLDWSNSLRSGQVCWHSGALSRAQTGLVLVPMAERASGELCAALGQCLDTRELQPLEPGVRRPSQLGVVAIDEAEGDEPGLNASLADRLAFWMDLRTLSLQDAPGFDAMDPARTSEARQRLAHMACSSECIERLGQASLAFGIDSLRAPWLAWQVAQCHAALEGRSQVNADDEQFALVAVLLPRATRMPAMPQQQEASESPQAPAPTEGDPTAPSDPPPPAPEGPPQAPAQLESVDPGEDLTLESMLAALPPDLLAQCLNAGWTTRRSSRSSLSQGSGQRARSTGATGRPLPPRVGKPGGHARLDVVASLGHAIARQRLRELEDRSMGRHPNTGLSWRMDDLQVRRRQPSRRCGVILAIDASGSTALQRLAQAKGAVELLLAQSYVRRDAVCVIGFRGRSAECLLPTTRSLVRAKRVLAAMPGGGGTPMASALSMSVVQAQGLMRQGLTPLLVVLSDGRANVNLEGIGGREHAHRDAMAWAQRIRIEGLASVWVDTAPQPEPLAQALSAAMSARYVPMPHVRSERLASVMQHAMAEVHATALA